MDDLSFSVSPNEELLDLRLFQCGWEQCAPRRKSLFPKTAKY